MVLVLLQIDLAHLKDAVPHIGLLVLLNDLLPARDFHGKAVESVDPRPELVDFMAPHCRLANFEVEVCYVLLVERQEEDFAAGERELLAPSEFLEQQEDGGGFARSREGHDESQFLLLVGRSAQEIVNDSALLRIRALRLPLGGSVSLCFLTRH